MTWNQNFLIRADLLRVKLKIQRDAKKRNMTWKRRDLARILSILKERELAK
jgi:ribosomal protein L29